MCHVLSPERCNGGEKYDDRFPMHGCTFQKRPMPGELAFYAKTHNMVPEDGTVINHSVPGPEGYCIPLFHFKALLTSALCVPLSMSRSIVATMLETHSLHKIIFLANNFPPWSMCRITSMLLVGLGRELICHQLFFSIYCLDNRCG